VSDRNASSEDQRVSPVKKFGMCRCEEKDPCVGSTEEQEERVCRVKDATCAVDWSVSP